MVAAFKGFLASFDEGFGSRRLGIVRSNEPLQCSQFKSHLLPVIEIAR